MSADRAPRALLDDARVAHGEGFRLADRDAGARSGLDKEAGRALADAARARIDALQERLYAQDTASLLVVLQGMDAAGKDGAIAHVMSGLNPQGVTVTSFKQPGPVERAHGFLWRVHAAAPSAGRIAIFNRSHYEDVLVCRVHPELLHRQQADWERDRDAFWRRRYEDIASFERYLAHTGTRVLKFFLHISKDEQRDRLAARLEDPDKHWKFSASDLAERARWDDYQEAYEQAIRHTAHPHAPWFVVPADHKWHARLVVAEAVAAALEEIDPRIPDVTEAQERAIADARKTLHL